MGSEETVKRLHQDAGHMGPEENIEAAKMLAEETRAQREAKRVISRKQRERQEERYQERFAEAVYEYLGFAPKHEKLARDIANSAAESLVYHYPY